METPLDFSVSLTIHQLAWPLYYLLGKFPHPFDYFYMVYRALATTIAAIPHPDKVIRYSLLITTNGKSVAIAALSHIGILTSSF